MDPKSELMWVPSTRTSVGFVFTHIRGPAHHHSTHTYRSVILTYTGKGSPGYPLKHARSSIQVGFPSQPDLRPAHICLPFNHASVATQWAFPGDLHMPPEIHHQPLHRQNGGLKLSPIRTVTKPCLPAGCRKIVHLGQLFQCT